MMSRVSQFRREETVCMFLFKGCQMVDGKESVAGVSVVLSDPPCPLQTLSVSLSLLLISVSSAPVMFSEALKPTERT